MKDVKWVLTLFYMVGSFLMYVLAVVGLATIRKTVDLPVIFAIIAGAFVATYGIVLAFKEVGG